MKRLSLTLTGVLLATSAMIAPGLAFAQTPTSQSPAAQAQQEPDATEVGEIVVLGRFIPEPNRESPEVAAFLTAEDLVRTGDSSAAAALTRVTGLTVVEGRFIYVRGLGERYSSALLNGSPLPSPEPLQRVVPLDLFPSNVLESVTVQKTYSANYPGEFGGGVIDLRTIGTPRESFLSASTSVGGSSKTTGKDGLVYFGSRTDFTGFDDGTRKVPNPIAALAFSQGLQINRTNFTPQQLQTMGHSLVNAPLRLLQRNTIPADLGFNISGGTTTELDIGTLGFIGVAAYGNSWQTRQGFQEEAQFSGDVIVPTTSKAFQSTQNDIQLNMLGGVSLSNPDYNLKWTNFFVRNTTKEARTSAGPSLNRGGAIVRDDYTEWFVRQLFSTQLTGEHFFMDDALQLKWRGAFANTSRDAPYESRFQYGVNAAGQFIHDNFNLISFSELDEDVISGGADVRYAMPLSEAREMVFSAGVARTDSSRSAIRRDLQLTSLAALTDNQRLTRIDFLYSDFNINPTTIELREVTGTNGAGAYEATQVVNAAYAQVEAQFIPLLQTTFGLRYEDGRQSVMPRDLFGGAIFPTTTLQESYFLPAFTATWNFAEDQQLRLGVSKTIGRPQFRELAPQSYLDPESDREFTGNPFLVDTEILNIDARYEWYFARQQYLTAGAFYKDLERPVESVVVLTGDQRQQSFLNAPAGIVYGVELEGKKYWEFPDAGSDFLANKRWLVQANYTWSDSEVKVGPNDTVRTQGGGGAEEQAAFFISDGSRLQGQSEHVANLQLGWEDDIARSRATFIVNYVSERITARGAGAAGAREPDYYQDPGVFLDFVYRKDFEYGGRELGFALEVRNILGTGYDEFQELGNRIRINTYDLGTSASVSLSARF